jgi:hypothetical protein
VPIMAVGVFVAVKSFNADRAQPTKELGVRFCGAPGSAPPPKCIDEGASPTNSGGVEVYADVLSVDPLAHNMTVRMTVFPPGSADPIALSVSSRVVQPFDKGATDPTTFDVPVQLSILPTQAGGPLVLDNNRSNRITSYPFDYYEAEFGVGAKSKPADGSLPKNIPTHVYLNYAVHGFRLDPVPYQDGFNIHIERAPSTVAFAVFVMVLMWLLTAAIVAMALILTILRHDIGPGVLGFLAAVLFAFPGIRNVLPGAPPLGSLNDYLSFFWCEGIVAITLVVLTVLFLTREARPPDSSSGGLSGDTVDKPATS